MSIKQQMHYYLNPSANHLIFASDLSLNFRMRLYLSRQRR